MNIKRLAAAFAVTAAVTLFGVTPVSPSGLHRQPEAIVLDKGGKIHHPSTADAATSALLANPTVWDGTPSASNWKIREAVSEWNKRSAFNATLTANESTASIKVYEKSWQDVNAMCNYTGPGEVVGCRDGGLIWLNSSYRTQPMAEHVGIHELGHAIGHGHVTGVKSVMLPSVDNNTWLRAPQQYDYQIQQNIYGG